MLSTSGAPLDLSREAFEVEALRWTDDVHRFALSLTRDEADADDVVQDTYLRAFRSWKSFIGGSDCRRWLFTICRNVYLRTRERSARWLPLDNAQMDAAVADTPTSRAWAEKSAYGFATVDVEPAIHSAVDSVPEPYRAAVIAVDIDDMSYESAAVALGIPIGTVRSRLFRGRRILQGRLTCHAVDLGVIGGRDSYGANIFRGRGSAA